jgi:hypothetical protein
MIVFGFRQNEKENYGKPKNSNFAGSSILNQSQMIKTWSCLVFAMATSSGITVQAACMARLLMLLLSAGKRSIQSGFNDVC